jgi:hypothetical protein
MTTYEEVAKEARLLPYTKDIFLAYMRARWADSEYIKCATGYATEWAERFANGIAYEASDSEGKRILGDIYRTISV